MDSLAHERKMKGKLKENERKMKGKWKQWATLRFINTKQGPTDLVDLVDLVGGFNPMLALHVICFIFGWGELHGLYLCVILTNIIQCFFSIQHWRWGATSQVGLPWQLFGTAQSKLQKGLETSTTLPALRVHKQICSWAWSYHFLLWSLLRCLWYFMLVYSCVVFFFSRSEHETNRLVHFFSRESTTSNVRPRRRSPVLGLVKELEKPSMSVWSSTKLSMTKTHLSSGGDGVCLRLLNEDQLSHFWHVLS